MKNVALGLEVIQSHFNSATFEVSLLVEFRGMDGVVEKGVIWGYLVVLKDPVDQLKYHTSLVSSYSQCLSGTDLSQYLIFSTIPHKNSIDDTRQYCQLQVQCINTTGIFEEISIMGSSDVKTVINVRPLFGVK